MNKYKKFILHQEYYDFLSREIQISSPKTDIREIEREFTMCEDVPYDGLGEIKGLLKSLDSFAKEKRQENKKYAWELFIENPDHWGSRGAPLFWAYAARQFSYDELPMSEETLKRKYLAIATLFGIDTADADEEGFCYIERFAAGGMSSGVVGTQFIRESLTNLIDRNRIRRGT